MFSSEESSLSLTSLQAKAGIGNLLKKLRNHFTKDANDPQLRRYWMPDSNSRECYDCGEKFTALRRRHHCRVCGQIFCNKCCKEDIPGNLIGYSSNSNLRVCAYCHQIVSSFTKNDVTTSQSPQPPLSVAKDDYSAALPFDCSYKTIPRPSVTNTVPHVATLRDLFIGASASIGSPCGAGAVNNSGPNGPGGVDNGRRMSAVERRMPPQEEANQYAAGIRSAASSPLFSFKRRGSLFHEDDLHHLGSNHTLRVPSDHHRSTPTSPYKSSPNDYASYPSSPGNKSTESDKKRERKRQDSLGSQEEGSHEPLWVREINASEASSDDKSLSNYSPSVEIYEGPGDQYQTREVYSKPKSSRKFYTQTSRDTLSSASAFEIEFDLENELVSASKPPIKEKSIPSSDSPDEKDSVDIKSVDGLTEELTLYYGQKILPEGVKSAADPVVGQKLEDLFEKICKKLLTQLLSEEAITLSWIHPVQCLTKKIASTVSPITIAENDGMDIRQYIKIKRIIGGNKSDYLIVNGLVFTKHVTHRKMRQNITRPKILLLSCPIVYNQRIEQKLTSLESIKLQEHSYLKNLVSKISSYNPDIVVSDKTVARIAQEMLLDLGITLVCNVKSKILEKLSRFTGAAIVSSLDAQIGCPELGGCAKFHVQTFNASKTLMFFEGCPPNLGCTIVLRGSLSLDELENLKDICYFMIFCQYNWRLEKSFLLDSFAQVPDPDDETNPELSINESTGSEKELDENAKFRRLDSRERRVESITIDDDSDPLRSMAANAERVPSSITLLSPVSTKGPSIRSPEPELSVRISHCLNEMVLTCSPLIRFDLPYLLSEESKDNLLKRYINIDDMFWSERIRSKNKKDLEKSLLLVEPGNLSPTNKASPTEVTSKLSSQPFILRDLKCKLNSLETQDLLADFRAQGSRVPKTKELQIQRDCDPAILEDEDISVDALDPKFHQRLPVLYSSFCLTSSASSPFCVDPYIVMMEYYSCFDISLGAFLDKYCFSPTYSCPIQGCNTSMLDHTRRFVHGKGCVQITLKEVKAILEPAQSSIVTWSWCQKCRTSSPLAALSQESACLSFGKFLELRLYGEKYQRREYGNYPGCFKHSLFLDHNQYFVHKNILACFKYEAINIYEVTLPLPRIKMKADIGWRAERTSSFSDSYSPPREKIEITIREKDPGSLIAFAMTSLEYEKQLTDIIRGTASPSVKKKFLISVESSASSGLSEIKESNQLDISASSSAVSFNSKATSNSVAVSHHIDLQFNDATTKYYCCIYFAEQFKKLRSELIETESSILHPADYSTPTPTTTATTSSSSTNIINPANGQSIEETFIKSISCCNPWTATGGKSGATFYQTLDDRFILKEMSRPELHSFLKIAKFYFDYVLGALNQNRPTLLAKIVGVYKISFKNSATNNASKMYLLVMENLFYQRNISLKFDLKGSDRNRWVRTDNPNNVVLLDENLIRSIRESPLYIRHHSKKILSTAIENDSLFLSSHSVMDYSLLVGMDEEHKEFVVGIIDYIRPYTWDKKIEMVVKSVGSHGKMPTIVSPDLYRERFCDKMNQYFLCVPDRWYGFEPVDKPIKGVQVYS